MAAVISAVNSTCCLLLTAGTKKQAAGRVHGRNHCSHFSAEQKTLHADCMWQGVLGAAMTRRTVKD